MDFNISEMATKILLFIKDLISKYGIRKPRSVATDTLIKY